MILRRSRALHRKICLTFVLCGIFIFSMLKNKECVQIGSNDKFYDRNIIDVNKHLCKYNGKNVPIFPKGKMKFVENIYEKGTLKFHKGYKNPCFYQTYRCKDFNRQVSEHRRLLCLPYFYIIGFPKCATTDLWNRLLLHPQIIAKHEKESHYIDDKRFNKQWSFQTYLDYFSATSDQLSELCEDNPHRDHTRCNIITGEGTVNTAAVNDMWYMLPENKGCTEPRITNPDYLFNINPDIRLIALIRDPVDRLWSDYLYLAKYFNYKTSPTEFHRNAVNAVAMYEDCITYFSPRGCANNVSIGSIQMRLRMGLYDIHIADWLRVFPRKRLLIVLTEDYKKNISNVLQHVFKHLGIDFPPSEIYNEMLGTAEKNVNNNELQMFYKTREMLNKFYAPSHKKVLTILQNSHILLKEPDR